MESTTQALGSTNISYKLLKQIAANDEYIVDFDNEFKYPSLSIVNILLTARVLEENEASS